MRILFDFLICPMPWFVKRFLMNKILGFKLHKSAYIGLSIVNSSFLRMNKNSRIGHLNIFRNMKLVDIENNAIIGNLNWISGEASNHILKKNSNTASLSIGTHTAITNRHYLDCSGGFNIGTYSTFAGVYSTLLSHSIDIDESVQKMKAIEIGDYCFISSNCIFIGGSSIPNYSIVGAGSVIRNKFTESYFLYSGNPAKPIKNISTESLYFKRSAGFVN